MSSNTAQLPPFPDTVVEPTQNTGAQSLQPTAAPTDIAAHLTGQPAPADTTSSGAGPDVQTTTNTVPHAATDAPGFKSESYGMPSTTGADAASGILGAAQTQLGAFASTAAQYLPQSVKETVAPYLPADTSVTARASEHDSTHATSYPSTELTGAGTAERVGGVGALPGRVNESSVADVEKVDTINTGTPQQATLGERVKESVAPYLPAAIVGTGASAAGVAATASEHDHHHQTSLPSTELTGAGSGEHVGGVGALPGSINQSGVALVPDERGNDTTSATFAGNLASARDAVNSSAAQAAQAVSHETAAGTAGLAGLAGAVPLVGSKQTTSLPSTEREGVRAGEHVSGAGPLPGSVDESGVAVLPDQRNDTSASIAAPVSQPQEKHEQKPLAAAATSEAAGVASATRDRGAEHKDVPTRGDGYQTDYHPADLHPTTADYSDVKTTDDQAGAESGTAQESHPGGTQGRSTNADESKISPAAKLAASNATADQQPQPQSPVSSPQSPTTPQKSKFMDKVKGEFKILAGKISNKESKVEEGRQLKRGISPSQTTGESASPTTTH